MEEKETGVLQIAGFFVVMILEKSGFLYILYKFFIILCQLIEIPCCQIIDFGKPGRYSQSAFQHDFVFQIGISVAPTIERIESVAIGSQCNLITDEILVFHRIDIYFGRL